MTTSERIYRFALYACPERFRDEFGEDSVHDFVRLADETRRRSGRLGVGLLCCRAVMDLLRTAVRERRRVGKRPSSLNLNALPHNLRDARRNLIATPGFTLLVVMTLALGMGANSAIFDAVYEVLLKPLPFPDSAELAVLSETDIESGSGGDSVTPANFEDWRALNTSFEDLAAMAQTSMNLTGEGDPERLNVHRVSSSFFSILGVEPLLGRAFVTEEDQPGGERVVLLSHGFWERHFGARGSALGEDILLDGESHRVIGVLPVWFRFPSRDIALFVPLAMDGDERSARSSHYLDVLGRVRSGVTTVQAAAEMDAIAARLAELHPDTNADNGIRVRPLREDLVGEGTTPLIVLFVAVSAVLFIAVANVANLLLARSASRQKEVAVRTALGASRSRILGQLMTESALLSLCGAGAGVLFAIWGRRLLEAVTPAHIALDTEWWRPATVGFALVLAGAVAVGMGLLPALQLSRLGHGPLLSLRSSSSRMSTRLRSTLIVGEVAIALVLLVLGGLMVRSFFNLTRVHPGFRAENVLTMRIELSGSRYQEHHQKVAFYRDLETRVARLPGIESSSFISMLPLTFRGGSIYFEIQDRVAEDTTSAPSAIEPIAVFRSVTAKYFRTLGIPLVEGRGFDVRDGSAAPKVAIINRTLAREFFRAGSALGKRIDIWGESTEIVGVVGDARQLAIGENVRPAIYVASEQRSFGFFDPRDFALYARRDPSSLVSAVRAEVWSIDPNQPIASIRTMEEIVADAVANDRVQTLLLTAFALVALLLAALGIYGVLTHTVSQRTDEIGLRMALGARTSDVLRMVAGEGMALTLLGIGLGLVGARALARVLEGLDSTLHGIEPGDPWTMAAISGLLATVALGACLAPAWRATRIDPLEALRED